MQLHVTSLPSGRLGREAYAFVDWLAAAGQSYWQVLPLGYPDRWGSPYKSRSAFACWPKLLEHPTAEVSAAEEGDFRTRHAYWIGDWEQAAGGRRAVLDQVRFEREWLALRRYGAQHGVKLIGDMPLYVAPASVDHDRHPEMFLDGLRAGAPPDRFTAKGQLWGNPVYDWPALRRRHYRWWVERLRRSAGLFDVIRLDHFRGLVAYWTVPDGARDARAGSWRRGPGAAPLIAAREALGALPLIAEDLGVITPPVEALRAGLKMPGMAVLEFLYDNVVEGIDPLNAGMRDRVLYTATHDQTTLRGWWDELDDEARWPIRAALASRGIRSPEPSWALIRLAYTSVAPLVMVQAQDLLALPADARMNTPGRASGNWSFKLDAGALTPALARRLRQITADAGRQR